MRTHLRSSESMPLKYTPTALRRSKGKEIRLRPLHPNVGIKLAYQRKMLKLIDEMNDSVRYWIESAYRNNEPRIALDDAMPTSELVKAIRKLRKQWLKNFDEGADNLANYFAKSVSRRTDTALAKILRDAGFSVAFQMTPAMRDIVAATTQRNVSLIKSIPEQYLKDVEDAVMRSIQAGRDLGSLTSYLEKTYGVTRRRAATIALSQNNMATSAMNRARQAELGITKARWRHSGGGKHPRPTHLKNNGKLYDVKKGWYDPAVKEWIWPGQLINCRCVSIAVIPGME